MPSLTLIPCVHPEKFNPIYVAQLPNKKRLYQLDTSCPTTPTVSIGKHLVSQYLQRRSRSSCGPCSGCVLGFTNRPGRLLGSSTL